MTVKEAIRVPDADVAGEAEASRIDGIPRQFAPLISDAWYVIADLPSVDHSLKGITVLDTPLVYYRREDGTAVVFDDRCPHRMFPLSKSHLIGDMIRCGYHGFTFDREGRCAFVPGSPHKPNFGLRQYPAAERGNWLWVWMGDPDDADPAKIPLSYEIVDDRSTFGGYMLNPCNYMLVLENLLDLTHLFYLHGPQVADQAFADEPPEALKLSDAVGAKKITHKTGLAILGLMCGDDPDRMIRREERNLCYPPSLIEYDGKLSPIDRFDEPLLVKQNRFFHAITPKSLYETHQFSWFDLGTPLLWPKEQARTTIYDNFFVQDVEAVGYQMAAIEQDKRGGFVERRMIGDRAAMQVQRILRRRANEAGATA